MLEEVFTEDVCALLIYYCNGGGRGDRLNMRPLEIIRAQFSKLQFRRKRAVVIDSFILPCVFSEEDADLVVYCCPCNV